MTIKIKKKIRLIAPFLLVVLLVAVSGFYWMKSSQDRFAAPRKDAPIVKFRVSKENTLMAVTGNLKYYGFVKDEDALKYALEHTKDNTPGKHGAIKVGNSTIDTETAYDISQTMSAWEIARILLNEGTPSVSDCNHGCPSSNPFNPEILPGGDIAPTWQEQMRAKYSWVKTFDDCVKAIGHDGGQLTSEEASKRTGHPRVCNTADGRYFVQGKEGWSNVQPYP
jgi:hypothetical protein